jgi:stearoyl-CoA desaturase (delta-9 desaturase)
LGAQGSPIFWACVHRGLHHPHADKARDLHSPIHGKWHAYMGWQFSLSARDVPFRATIDLSSDPQIKFLHKYYYSVFWFTYALAFIIDARLMLFGLVIPAFISMHMENMIDLFCHLRRCGYRNHEIDDNSVNVPLLGFFDWGQGWHNNHHARPNDYNFGGDRWFELDPCAFLVPLIRKKPRTMPSPATLHTNK